MTDDEEFPEPDGSVTDKQVSHLIDGWLSHARPERYDAGDKDWMDSVVKQARREMLRVRTAEQALDDAAQRRVYQRESLATRRTNKILRDIDDTGQLPLGWGDGDAWRVMLFDILHMPLSIARNRVRFGAASAADLVSWELESAREQDKRNKAEASSRSGARFLAEMATRQNVRRVEDLRMDGGENQ